MMACNKTLNIRNPIHTSFFLTCSTKDLNMLLTINCIYAAVRQKKMYGVTYVSLYAIIAENQGNKFFNIRMKTEVPWQHQTSFVP